MKGQVIPLDEVNINGEDYVAERLAAQMLGRHPGTLRNWRCDGRSPVKAHRFGARVFYVRRDVDALVRPHRAAA